MRQVKILLVVLMFNVNTSCLKENNDNISRNLQNEAWYENHFNTKKVAYGIKDTPYSSTNFHFDEVKHLSHDEILKTMEDFFIQTKKDFADSQVYRLNKLHDFMKVVDDNNLIDSSPFYKNLFNAKNDDERVAILYEEQIKVSKILKEATDSKDSDKILTALSEISYMDIVNKKNMKDYKKTKNTIRKKEGEQNSVMYVNGVKVEKE